jgi:tetratricopeptide (TPR) repeat protein
MRRLMLVLLLAMSPCVVLAGTTAALEQTIVRAHLDEIQDDQLEPARKTLNAAAKTDADSGRLRTALALVEMRLGNGAKARKQARKAVELTPDDPEAHYHRGIVCISTVQDALMINMMAIASAAESSYKRAIELRPEYLEAHVALAQYQMGRAMFTGGGLEEAEGSAEILLTIEGGELDARIILATVCAQEDRWPEALAELDKGIGSTTDEEAISRAVTTAFTLAFFVLEDAPTVIDLAENKYAAHIADSGDTSNWVVGRAYAQTSRHEEAVAQFRRVLETNPEARSTKFYLAESLAKLGERDEARTWYKRFIDENPKGELTKQAKKALKELK